MIILLSLFLFGYYPNFDFAEDVHSNVVGELRIDNFKQEVYVEAVVDKHLLTLALIREADCPPDQVLETCGGQYVTDHLSLSVNGKQMRFRQTGFQIFKDQVLYRFFLGECEGSFESIEVESDYLLNYYEHSVLHVKVGVNDTSKSYSLTALRQKITAIIS